jgi:S-layer homology domain
MKVAKVLTVTTLAALCFNSQPAQASDFIKNLLQQFSGTVANWDDLESRRAAAESQILQALQAGNITVADSNSLRAQLKPLADAVVQGRASGKALNFTQGLMYAQSINSVTAALQQAIATKQSNLPDIDALQTELGQQIDNSQKTNQLSADDAAKLRSDLRTVADIEAAIKSSGDGTLNAKQIETISTRLSDIKTRIAQAISMGQSAIPELTDRANKLQTNITDARADGRLSADQAQSLLTQLDQANKHRANLLNLGQYLNGKQILDLAGELDGIASSLQTSIRNDAAAQAQQFQNQSQQYQNQSQQYQNQQPQAQTPASTQVNAPVQVQVNNPSDASLTMGNSANSYKDVVGYWGEAYISNLAARGIIGGFPDGTFHPNDNITRAQFAAIAVKALNVPPNTGSASFNDVPAKYWGAAVIGAVSNAGLVTGFPNGTFAPEDKLTRAQALVILAKALGSGYSNSSELNNYSDAASIPSWALPSVTRAASAHIIANFPDASTIAPNALATRGEVAALMYQTLLALGKPLPKISVGLLPQYAFQNNPSAPPTNANQTTAAPVAAPPLAISNIEFSPTGRLSAGDVLTVRASGTAHGQATFSIKDGPQGLPMTEKRDGVYEGFYTVRKSDNIGLTKVEVTLAKDTLQPVTVTGPALELVLDARAPEIDISPRPNANVQGTLPSIVVRFNDGRGSGVDSASVRLIVNNQDVTAQSIMDSGMIAYRPNMPLTGNVSAEIKVADKCGNATDFVWNFNTVALPEK